jgi:hypothetical protein
MAIWYRGVFAKRHDRGDKTVVIDFDGTICEDDCFPGFGKPMPGVKEALDKFKEAGLDIVVLSCRIDPTAPRMMREQKRLMEEWLEEHEIPYTRIDEGVEGKVRGLAYVDNKALHYKGGNDWDRICKKVLSLR